MSVDELIKLARKTETDIAVVTDQSVYIHKHNIGTQYFPCIIHTSYLGMGGHFMTATMMQVESHGQYPCLLDEFYIDDRNNVAQRMGHAAGSLDTITADDTLKLESKFAKSVQSVMFKQRHVLALVEREGVTYLTTGAHKTNVVVGDVCEPVRSAYMSAVINLTQPADSSS